MSCPRLSKSQHRDETTYASTTNCHHRHHVVNWLHPPSRLDEPSALPSGKPTPFPTDEPCILPTELHCPQRNQLGRPLKNKRRRPRQSPLPHRPLYSRLEHLRSRPRHTAGGRRFMGAATSTTMFHDTSECVQAGRGGTLVNCANLRVYALQ